MTTQAHWKNICLWTVLGLGAIAPAMATDLVAYTEEWPPYNYAEKQEIKGISTDFLRAACETAGIKCTFQIVPWARAYKIVGLTPNTVIYTTARKPSRENEFLWIGPILPRTTWVYGKAASSTRISSFKDLAQNRIGVVREEAAQGDLQAMGVPASAFNVQSSNADVLRMLLNGSVDAMVDTEVGMAWNLRGISTSQAAVQKLLKLTDDGAYYFALNRDSDPELVKNLQAAIDKLRRNGKFDAILRHYTKSHD